MISFFYNVFKTAYDWCIQSNFINALNLTPSIRCDVIDYFIFRRNFVTQKSTRKLTNDVKPPTTDSE